MSLFNHFPQVPKMEEIIQFRLSTQDKERLLQASHLKGVDHSLYIRSHIMDQVDRDLEKLAERRILFSDEDWELLVETMEQNPLPNTYLKQKYTDFRQKYG